MLFMIRKIEWSIHLQCSMGKIMGSKYYMCIFIALVSLKCIELNCIEMSIHPLYF